MIRVIEQGQVLGPVLLGKGIEPLHLGPEIVVDEHAEGGGHSQRVVDRHRFRVRLPDQDDARAPLSLKEPFEGRALQRLMLEDLLRIAVAGWENHEHAGHGTGHHPGAYERSRMREMVAGQQVECADRRHHAGGRHDGGGHRMGILPEQPGIGE